MNEIKPTSHNVELDKLTEAQRAELLADLSKGVSPEASESIENTVTDEKVLEEHKERPVSIKALEQNPVMIEPQSSSVDKDLLSESAAKQALTNMLNKKTSYEDLVIEDPEAFTDALKDLKKAA
jgi:hypothetical protein